MAARDGGGGPRGIICAVGEGGGAKYYIHALQVIDFIDNIDGRVWKQGVFRLISGNSTAEELREENIRRIASPHGRERRDPRREAGNISSFPPYARTSRGGDGDA